MSSPGTHSPNVSRAVIAAIAVLAVGASALGFLLTRWIVAQNDRTLTTAHPVTEEMLERSEKGRDVVPTLTAEASDGREYRVPLADGRRPEVLVFIGADCPCSVTAQPLFNRLYETYGGSARFLGVINADAAGARRWGQFHEVPFPILGDPDERIIRAYEAENSAYVALLDQGGKAIKLWPGFSEGMLSELCDELSAGSANPTVRPEFPLAPSEMYSGCPFEWVFEE